MKHTIGIIFLTLGMIGAIYGALYAICHPDNTEYRNFLNTFPETAATVLCLAIGAVILTEEDTHV